MLVYRSREPPNCSDSIIGYDEIWECEEKEAQWGLIVCSYLVPFSVYAVIMITCLSLTKNLKKKFNHVSFLLSVRFDFLVIKSLEPLVCLYSF